MKHISAAPLALAVTSLLLLPTTAVARAPGGGAHQVGGPVAGLTPAQLAAFERGKIMFTKRFKPSEGLGPFYNATACASCHSTPVPGGSSQLYRNFYLAAYGSDSSQGAIPPFMSPVVPAYGSGESHATTLALTLEGGRPLIPATVFNQPVMSAQRNGVPIFGVGLFEQISDVDILANEDMLDANGDGISGRPNSDFAASLGRFGSKAQSNNVELFTRGPMMMHMGITSNPFEGEAAIVSLCRAQVSANPNDPLTDQDAVTDPEISHEDLGDLIAFARFLAPPQKLPFDAAATNGEQLFDSVGCTKCHIPSLPSTSGPVEAYTDLLIHYMGADLADHIKLGLNGVTSLEFRTAPLWGVSMHAPYLHDGRAETLREAIELHGGEASAVRDEFLGRPPADQADIISFLEHL